MADSVPTVQECVTVVVKAVAARRARHRDDPGCAGLTSGAIAERVTGITLPPRAAKDGWWLVGRVLDEIEETEYSVWCMPVARRIGISRREKPAAALPAPPIATPFYYDGLRRKWIDSLTGEVVADPNPSQPGAYESRPRSGT